MKKLILILILLCNIVYGQKGGLNYPVLTPQQAVSKGYILITNYDSLAKYAKINNSKLFISAGFNIAQRCTVSGNNVIIESDRRSTITSTVWLSVLRLTETILVTGKNVTIKGLKLKGASSDILTLDYTFYQEGIRVAADSCSIINCSITNFDFAAIYAHLFSGLLIEQCYLARCKRSGYGYGVWFEGKSNMIARVRDCIFEDNRESIDAGGNRNVWIAEGNVTDRGFTSHRNPTMQAGIGTTCIENYFIGNAGSIVLPYPSVDTGWVTLVGNYTFADSGAFGVKDSINRKAKITIQGNHYNGADINLPNCSFTIDSIYLNPRNKDVVKITINSLYSVIEINWGDGYENVIMQNGIIYHTYEQRGTYNIKVRTFDKRSVPSLWFTKKIVLGKGEINFAYKTTARFTPTIGYYKVEFLIDDSVIFYVDAVKAWTWNRYSNYLPLKGNHRIALRITCIKDCSKAVQVWFDDFDFNGTIANAGFEDDDNYYHPPYSIWRQKFNGSNIGSGITNLEKCSGEKAWRFEFRPTTTVPIKAGSYAELYQIITFN